MEFVKRQASYISVFLSLALIIVTAVAWYSVVDTGIKLIVPEITKKIPEVNKYKATIQYQAIFAAGITIVTMLIIKMLPRSNILALLTGAKTV